MQRYLYRLLYNVSLIDEKDRQRRSGTNEICIQIRDVSIQTDISSNIELRSES